MLQFSASSLVILGYGLSLKLKTYKNVVLEKTSNLSKPNQQKRSKKTSKK